MDSKCKTKTKTSLKLNTHVECTNNNMNTYLNYMYFTTSIEENLIYDLLETGFNDSSISYVRKENNFECTGYWNFKKYSFNVFVVIEEYGVNVAFRKTSGDEFDYEQAIMYLAYLLQVEKNPPRIYQAEHIDNEVTRKWDKKSMDGVLDMIHQKKDVDFALQILGMCILNPQKQYIFLDYGANLIPALFELNTNLTVCMMIFAEFIKIKGSNMDLIHTLIPKVKLNNPCPHYTRETLGVILALCQRDTLFKYQMLLMRDEIALETRKKDVVASNYAIEILSLFDEINPSAKPDNAEYHVL
jgi:hypothetical protein